MYSYSKILETLNSPELNVAITRFVFFLATRMLGRFLPCIDIEQFLKIFHSSICNRFQRVSLPPFIIKYHMLLLKNYLTTCQFSHIDFLEGKF